MEKRKYPRRTTRDIILILAGLTVAVVLLVTYLLLQARHDISEQYIGNATLRAAGEFSTMQDSIAGGLELVKQWGESGAVSLGKTDELKGLLLPIFKKTPMLSGMTIADDAGQSYFILPDGTERVLRDTTEFDPRLRPWFGPALETDGVYWSEQYRFHTLGQIGITASASYPLKKGRGVVAFDVLLDDLYREIKKMAPSENSEIFVFRRDELLLIPESTLHDSSFIPISSVTNALARDMHRAWQGQVDDIAETISFMHHGRVWWCGFRPIEGQRQNVWMGVMVPESDIVGDVSRRQQILGAIGLAWIVAVVAVGYGWSRRVSRSIAIAANVPPSIDEGVVLKLIESGENRAVEFKATMRMNLHAKKPGKEIEIAWLKGVAAFLNTDGGTLLLGVTDAGEVTGLEQDVFENDDKCRLHFKNLVATHVGAEFSKYIRLLLVQVKGMTVGVVRCSRSSEPVFLKNGNKEAFYIRNGPSSDELPVSKALKYIKHRK